MQLFSFAKYFVSTFFKTGFILTCNLLIVTNGRSMQGGPVKTDVVLVFLTITSSISTCGSKDGKIITL